MFYFGEDGKASAAAPAVDKNELDHNAPIIQVKQFE